jgi:heme O synthase-like polyprenyltransferase
MSPLRKAAALWFVVIMSATLIAALGNASQLLLASFGVIQVAGYVALYYMFKGRD